MKALYLMQYVVFFSLLDIVCCQLVKSFPDPNSIADPQVVVKKWEQLESRMSNLVKDGVKMVLPMAIEASQSLNISATCVRDAWNILRGVKKMKIWALKFIDASSKSIDGLLDYTVASLGDYDECVNIEVFDDRFGKENGKKLMRGKYCPIHVRPYLPPKEKRSYYREPWDIFENFTKKDTVIGYIARFGHMMYHVPLKLSVCVPSGCSEKDINEVLGKIAEYAGFIMKTPRCEMKQEAKITPVMIGVITLYGFTLFLVIIGTMTDVYLRSNQKKCKSTGIRILTSFSFISNFQKVLDTSTSSERFACLNSIKTLTIMWIINGHTQMAFAATLHKGARVFDIVEEFSYQSMMNTTLGVDTFFFISATLVCYNVTKLVKISKKSLNLGQYVFHRIYRLLPVYAYVIAFVFLMPLLISGPMLQDQLNTFVKPCEKNWWANFLFINNFYDKENMCYVPAWYITLDVQLYIAALVILLPLMRWPKVGITMAVTTIIASMIGSWLTVYIYDLMPKFTFATDPDLINDTYIYYYILPHAHAGPYCIGILCGYLFAVKPELKIPKTVQILGWFTTIVSSMCIMYGVPKWNGAIEPSFIEALFYSSSYRVIWSSCVAWVVTCCYTGHGGIVNYILSWKIWIPLARLTFLVYLIHPVVMALHVSSIRTEVMFDLPSEVWRFIGDCVISYVCAFGASMMVESPMLSLEKIFHSGGRKRELLYNHEKGAVANDVTFSGSNGVHAESITKGQDPEAALNFRQSDMMSKM